MKLLEKFAVTLFAGFLPVTIANSAQALDLYITYDPDVSYQEIVATETAKAVWQDIIKDDITVNIHIQSKSTAEFGSPNTLAMTFPAFESNVTLKSLVSNYKADLTKEYPNEIVDTKVTSGNFCKKAQYGTDYYTGTTFGTCYNPDYWALSMLETINTQDGTIYPYFAPDTYRNDTTQILATTAQLKAIGNWDYFEQGATGLDGLIVINRLNSTATNALKWDYSYLPSAAASNTQPYLGRELDLTTTMIHEIGHVLGFVSGSDLIDTAQDITNTSQRTRQVSLLDFFKRNASGQIDLEYGTDSRTPAVFYVGKVTKQSNDIQKVYGSLSSETGFSVSKMSTGIHTELNGDGAQTSHFDQEMLGWSHWNSLTLAQKQFLQKKDDLMSPFLLTNWQRRISPLDAISFDALGYQIDYKTSSSRTQQYYYDLGVQRAKLVVEGLNPRILSNLQLVEELNLEVVALMSNASDVVTGLDTSYKDILAMTKIVDEGLEKGLTQSQIVALLQEKGFTQKTLTSKAFSISGLRNSFKEADFSVPKRIQNSVRAVNQNNELTNIRLDRKGIFYHEFSEDLNHVDHSH